MSFLTNSRSTVSIEVAAGEVLQLPQAVCGYALLPSLLERFNPNTCLKIITTTHFGIYVPVGRKNWEEHLETDRN